jgi:serine kinase of HPr protein (carbohydrate metabolism regulator)
MTTTRLHATAVAIAGRAVLLVGQSGAGKSDLALRLIDRGAVLIADDQVALRVDGGVLIAQSPPTIRGMMEVRGVGIIDTPTIPEAEVALIVDLDATPDRLPDPRRRDIGGVEVPLIALNGLEASAPIKVEAALRRFGLPLEGRPR